MSCQVQISHIAVSRGLLRAKRGGVAQCPMAKFFKWLVFLALGVVVVLGVVAFLLQRWVRTDEFRERAEQQASVALGVPVTMTHVAVDIWPLPAVALSNISVQSMPPMTLGRVEVRPQWRPLLQGRLEVATLVVRRAELPQQGIDALLLVLQKRKPATEVVVDALPAEAGIVPPISRIDWLPRRTILDDVSWLSSTGARTTVEGDIRVGDDGLPDTASMTMLEGNLKGLSATLTREVRGPADTAAAAPGNTAAPSAPAAAPAVGSDQWALKVDVGGGQIQGTLGLQRVRGSAPKASEELLLQGRLQTRNVEVSALTAPSRALTGQLEATTTLSARAATTAALVEGLQTQTTFSVKQAVVHGIDLLKAVQTVGLSRGGETRLDALSGHVSTQGRAAQLSNLQATSGALGATGNVGVSADKALNGTLDVSLKGDGQIVTALGGAARVPLVVSGTLTDPEVTLSRSALIGAAIGTAVMPGVGTGVGAKLGERLSEKLRGLVGK